MQARVVPAVVSLVLAFAGCSSILQIEPGQLDESSAASSSGVGGGGGLVSECEVASDCPSPPFPDCRAVACAARRCVLTDAAEGAPTTSQIAGDCQRIECDGHGLVRGKDADDPRDDGRECTADTCAQGVPVNTAKGAGTPCQQGGGAVCDGAGDCVGCLSDADCAGQICKSSSCVPMGCSNGVKDNGETDVDCGGPCDPCADGHHCVINNDCVNAICKSGACKGPTCGDAVKNGAEADVDCGGPCAPCTDGKSCNAPSDCAGGVCGGHLCCTSIPDAVSCLGHCGLVANNCGQPITCGICLASALCVQGACVCVPELPTATCASKCGVVLNNCGQPYDCGLCTP